MPDKELEVNPITLFECRIDDVDHWDKLYSHYGVIMEKREFEARRGTWIMTGWMPFDMVRVIIYNDFILAFQIWSHTVGGWVRQ